MPSLTKLFLLINTDIKSAVGQHFNQLFSLPFLWKCLETDGNVQDSFNLTKAHALIGPQIRTAA